MCRSKDCRENSAIPTMCFFFGYLLSHGRKSKPFFSFLESQPVWCIHPDQLRYVNHKIPYIPWVQMSRVVPQRPKILGQIYPHKKKLTYPYQDSWHWPIDPFRAHHFPSRRRSWRTDHGQDDHEHGGQHEVRQNPLGIGVVVSPWINITYRMGPPFDKIAFSWDMLVAEFYGL